MVMSMCPCVYVKYQLSQVWEQPTYLQTHAHKTHNRNSIKHTHTYNKLSQTYTHILSAAYLYAHAVSVFEQTRANRAVETVRASPGTRFTLLVIFSRWAVTCRPIVSERALSNDTFHAPRKVARYWREMEALAGNIEVITVLASWWWAARWWRVAWAGWGAWWWATGRGWGWRAGWRTWGLRRQSRLCLYLWT